MLTDTIQEAIYNRLGELIKEARTKAEVKQELLAEYLNLSRISVSNIENGKQKVQLHTLVEISKYLNLDICSLINPLMEILKDTVSSKHEKRINKGTESPHSKELPVEGNKNKVKEFINFLEAKHFK